MTTQAKDVHEQIREVDGRLLVASDRLRRYRTTGQTTSVIVQMGAVDRMLAERFELMKQRDAKAAQ